jgi:RNA recognition motif-containing protein
MTGEKKKIVGTKQTQTKTASIIEDAPKPKQNGSDKHTGPVKQSKPKVVSVESVVEPTPEKQQRKKPVKEIVVEPVEEEAVVVSKPKGKKTTHSVVEAVTKKNTSEIVESTDKKRKSETPSEQPQKKEKVPRDTLHLTNVPPSLTEKTLREYLDEIGKIIYVDLRFGKNGALVQFNKELGDDVLEYHGATIEGNRVGVKFFNIDDTKITVTPIAKDMTVDELKEYVEEIGPVKSLTITKAVRSDMYYPNQGVITFKNLESIKKCRLYNGADIHGRTVTFA